jgi:hypothetical protein
VLGWEFLEEHSNQLRQAKSELRSANVNGWHGSAPI